MVLHSESEHSWRSSSSNDDPQQSSKDPDSSEHRQSDSEQQVSNKGNKHSDEYGWSNESNEGPKPPNEEHEHSEGSQEEAESSDQWLEHSDKSQEEATSSNRQQDDSDEYQEDAGSSDRQQEYSDKYQEDVSSNWQQEDSGEYKEDTKLSNRQQEYSDKYQEDKSSELQQEYSDEEADLSDQQQEHSDVEHKRADDVLSDEESDDSDGKSDRSDDKSEESDGNLGLSDEEVEKSVCLDPNEVLTTDYSEISGSNDDTLSDTSHWDTSSSTQSGAHLRTHKKKLPSASFFKDTKPPPPPPLLPHVRAPILSSHSKGLNLKEIQAQLSQETDIQVCIRTVKHYLKRLNVKLLANNVADGTVTMEQVVDMCIDAYNLTRRRRDHLTSLPTACTADFCYSTPKSFATTGQLVPVPANKLNLMIVKDFPDCVEMFQHTPVWFDQLGHRILKRIGIKLTDITVGTVWTVFHQMLPLVEAEVDRQSCSPSD
ncbi:hypothetical protein PSHT_16298 [Puccinia striiformis]|uniref:Uncharacterized protein n=1 Tax=Puccinia striiformis TaxID=27350 RepID=A0A2S4UAM8_9BASI|nr:hypothetical protein PSHT_16298 [Puccinia striiformis]